jgi:hypothetical protein
MFIDLSGIVNCNTFSVMPSVINENAKKRAVPFSTKRFCFKEQQCIFEHRRKMKLINNLYHEKAFKCSNYLYRAAPL